MGSNWRHQYTQQPAGARASKTLTSRRPPTSPVHLW